MRGQAVLAVAGWREVVDFSEFALDDEAIHFKAREISFHRKASLFSGIPALSTLLGAARAIPERAYADRGP